MNSRIKSFRIKIIVRHMPSSTVYTYMYMNDNMVRLLYKYIYKWLVGKRKLTTELSPKGLPRSYKVNQASRNLSSGEFRADVTEFLRFGLLYLIEAASRIVIILYKASFFFSSIFLALSKLFKAETSRLCVSGL